MIDLAERLKPSFKEWNRFDFINDLERADISPRCPNDQARIVHCLLCKSPVSPVELKRDTRMTWSRISRALVELAKDFPDCFAVCSIEPRKQVSLLAALGDSKTQILGFGWSLIGEGQRGVIADHYGITQVELSWQTRLDLNPERIAKRGYRPLLTVDLKYRYVDSNEYVQDAPVKVELPLDPARDSIRFTIAPTDPQDILLLKSAISAGIAKYLSSRDRQLDTKAIRVDLTFKSFEIQLSPEGNSVILSLNPGAGDFSSLQVAALKLLVDSRDFRVYKRK